MPAVQPGGLLLLAGAVLTLRSSNVSAKRGVQLTRGYSSTSKPLKVASTGPSTSAPTSCSDLQSRNTLKQVVSHFNRRPYQWTSKPISDQTVNLFCHARPFQPCVLQAGSIAQSPSQPCSDRVNMKMLAPACGWSSNPAGRTTRTGVWQPDSLPAVSLIYVQLPSRGAVAWAAPLGLGQGICWGIFHRRVGAPHLRRGKSGGLSGWPQEAQHQALQTHTATSLSPSALGSWHCANMRRPHQVVPECHL